MLAGYPLSILHGLMRVSVTNNSELCPHRPIHGVGLASSEIPSVIHMHVRAYIKGRRIMRSTL